MRTLTVIGVLLIVAGLIALAYQGITYTSRKSVVDIGPLHATADTDKTIPLPPIVGISAVVAGTAVLIAGARQRS